MEKTKLFSFAVFALLLLNLGILSYLFLHQPANKPHKRNSPREIIVERLALNADQQKQYDKLIAIHRSEIDSNEQQIKACKQELYSLLNTKSPSISKRDSLITAISEFQKRIELAHFNHFSEIRNLCTPEQLNDFTALTTELTRIFARPKHPPRHER
ncbi:Spy/CpxP family protein refolding chaperone [Flavobacterium aurantiibacter]|uniref:Periplasmic heavy metal sensor n=1 Tax=Flavobacterium aurantiibacter TaxID=2023067 RepID=A0A255ZW21_9FLAO|nr:periplasmic heavy metal sensor [Flavobacterium aurantiibacter]OYQ45114.1 hypothetical protein CHX27_06705 [Flavobacterium aurantiibacter]